MNARSLSWTATLMAMAMSVSLPAQAQESTGDPFLDAMLNDQKAEEATAAQQAAAEAAMRGAAAEETGEAGAAEAAPARLTRPAEDLVGVSDATLESELAGSTGVLVNEQVYDGKPVKSVSVRYISGTRVVQRHPCERRPGAHDSARPGGWRCPRGRGELRQRRACDF